MAETNRSLPTLAYLLQGSDRPYIHRDLSWLQFNERVLAEARSKQNPTLEKLKFLAISSSNMDEFFMIRFASLLRSISSAKVEETKESLIRIHSTLLQNVHRFTGKQARTLKALAKEAADDKIFLHTKVHKKSDAFALGKEIFEKDVLPNLSMKADFQFAALQELQNLQMLVHFEKNLYFEVPKSLPPLFWRQIPETEQIHIFFLDDLILTHLNPMLPVKGRPGILRITRDSDFTVDLSDEDTESIPDLIKKTLSTREKGRLVRVQFNGYFPEDFFTEASVQLKIDARQFIRAPSTLCLHGLFGLKNDLPKEIASRSSLSSPSLKAMIPLPFRNSELTQLFPALHKLDFVLHHPYDSFDAYIQWVEEACNDPDVVSIEQTIYRIDSASGVVEILKKAAQTKKISVILELRARFDEWNNLQVAEELRKAGVRVAFGFGALKLHAKITLVTRKEGDKLVRYTHLSTGNYNAKTARQYTDISILSGNQEIGEDARHFFDAVFQNKVPENFKQLVTAPTVLHQKIKTLIRKETDAAKAGQKARIIAKVNALVDEKIIEDLYAASSAGVQIDLIVRGSCSLIPGVKGLSENIRVISIVDRFLEHSRIYYFQNSEVIYLSSADWMPRNFFSRLEIAFPVLDKRIYNYIVNIVLPGYFADNVKARRLTSLGIWEKVPRGQQEHRAQGYFEELAKKEYINTPLFDHPFFKREES